MKTFKTLTGIAIAALLLAGCASPQPGMSREQVLASWGTPTRTVPLASGGTRLQYSTQPTGQTATMVDLDAAGKVVSVRQVLNMRDFSRIEVGKWTRADVETEFGPPAKTDGVASWSGDIMTYRWMDGDQPMFFFVYLDAGKVVRRVGQGMEFPVRMNDR
ncbi:hypothetical protein SAMN05216350_105238 [Polaromonas sp. YR568]|uniref:hypothetical protein n=1 Tax=Polaromonas sp. YR568 TaxID=1855301 RepID=UPI0008F10633|nr:hypothetical protein [Polaromonas sp. YR568]SFU80383.1 hypothetical protein SAMN05216350_105238 [Polaromonas sp. YR568]